ncbi:MAG: cupin domain-containing protein [Chloroflexi bacterium]|nr:cupin domain-containing protein [Chloroflexota bacterium]
MAGEDYRKLSPMELARKRHALVEEMGRLEEELNRRRQQDRHIMRAGELDWREPTATNPLRRATVVAPENGFNIHNFHVFMAEVPPGKTEGTYHMHGEAVKYYLQGKGVEIVGEKQYEVKAGDAVFIPAGTWHGSQNPFPEPMRFLAVAHSAMGVPLITQAIFKNRER